MAFTRFTKNVLNVSALPDRVQNQAQTLKATFDQAGVDIKTALNALIVELEASTSADNIGADVQSVATKTVQAILTAFEEAIADRYTKTEAETLLAIETNNLLADLDINLTTGVITTTKKDGTKVTFDTAIEKVPSKFEFVESGDTYLLKITNVDGSITQADVTKLMNIYNFNNSDYITFEVTGEGNKKTVTANIKANSIGLDKLSLSVVSTLEGYMNSARDSATAAKTSETNARASELNALEAKNTAVTKANEASASASAAKTSETNAEYWAKQAQAGGGGGGGITEIPIASADTLGGIKVGEGLEITEDGVLSALGGGSGGEVTILLEGEFATQSTTLTLSDNIKNYDILVVNPYMKDSTGNYILKAPLTIMVNQISYNGDQEYCAGCNVVPTTLNNGYSIRFGFGENGNTLLLGVIYKSTSYNSFDFGIRSVYGIKLGGGSGGNIKVLEASTDNVIDFNTLTDEGIYLIKNCSDTLGHTLNSDINTTNTCTVELEVLKIKSDTSEMIYQRRTTGNASITLYRAYDRLSATPTWTAWEVLKISALHIFAGMLATGMGCNTPTEDTHLANKGYVDGKTWVASKIQTGTFAGQVNANATAVSSYSTSQVRNIKASTSDLTAGTSTLATGDIYLVYEQR